MNNALGIAVVFDFITLIAVETRLEVFVDVVGMVDSVCTVFVIGYWLFDVGIVDEVVIIDFVVVLSEVVLVLGSDNLVDGHGLFDL